VVKYELEDLPKPDTVSADARAITIALLAIQAELKILRADYQPAAEINKFNLGQIEEVKRKMESGVLGVGLMPDLRGDPRRN
jgi:hypothetical protein